MKKYKGSISKIKSNLFFRFLLCMILLLFGAAIVKLSNSCIAFARIPDAYEINSKKIKRASDQSETSFVVDEDVIVVNLNEKKYIVANKNTSNKYPKNWIGNFNKKILVLQKIFPSGKYWNHMGQDATNPKESNNIYSVTDIPCNHYENGEIYCNAHYGKSDELYPYEATCSQCRGFASMLSDFIFGKDAPVRYFEDYDELRIGDQARIDGDYHSVFIIDKTDEYVIVAECNSDLETCQINWGRKILRENMNGWYISRWSD